MKPKANPSSGSEEDERRQAAFDAGNWAGLYDALAWAVEADSLRREFPHAIHPNAGFSDERADERILVPRWAVIGVCNLLKQVMADRPEIAVYQRIIRDLRLCWAAGVARGLGVKGKAVGRAAVEYLRQSEPRVVSLYQVTPAAVMNAEKACSLNAPSATTGAI